MSSAANWVEEAVGGNGMRRKRPYLTSILASAAMRNAARTPKPIPTSVPSVAQTEEPMTALAILAQVSALSGPAPLPTPAAAAHVPCVYLPDVLLGVIGSYLPLGGYGLRTLNKSLLASNAFGFITTKYGTSQVFYPCGVASASKVIALLHKTVNNWRAGANFYAEREVRDRGLSTDLGTDRKKEIGIDIFII
jgi:hypothetical protein